MNHDRNVLVWLADHWKQVVVIILCFLFGHFILGPLAFGEENPISCVADGHPDFKDGSEAWCKWGMFERVHTDWDEEKMIFKGTLTFNEIGNAYWIGIKGQMKDLLSGILVDLGKLGMQPGSTIQVRHAGDILMDCKLLKDESVECVIR